MLFYPLLSYILVHYYLEPQGRHLRDMSWRELFVYFGLALACGEILEWFILKKISDHYLKNVAKKMDNSRIGNIGVSGSARRDGDDNEEAYEQINTIREP